MKTILSKWWLWVIIIAVLVGMWLFSSYNQFTKASLSVDNQWAKVETQYQRRLDLIPNLANSVKGIMKQETAVFGRIADARQGYANARTVDEKVAASNQMESAFGRLLAIMENYPMLRSNEQVNTLMVSLEGTENRISVERTRFNDEVTAYNTLVKMLPQKFAAMLLGFAERPLFKAESGAEKAPTVDLTN